MIIASSIVNSSKIVSDFSTLRGKIAIFGGSFDPIHLGHIELAKKVKETFQLDSVIFIPAKQNPLKPSPPAEDKLRFRMVYEAIKNEKGLLVSDIEIQRNKTSYSFETMSRIKEVIHKDVELKMILGSDCIQNFHKWTYVHELISISDFIIVNREQNIKNSETFLTLLENFTLDEILKITKNIVSGVQNISSTKIRESVNKNELSKLEVPKEVKAIIIENELYR